MKIFSKNNRFFNKKAFTLVELLVVISIIGILSSTVFASISSARSRARDAVRKSDLAQIAKAFRLYYEQNGTYRIPGTGWIDGSGAMTGVGNLSYDYDFGGGPAVSISQGLISAGLLPSDIKDPSGLTAGYNSIGGSYMYYASGEQFTLWTSLENPSATDSATLNNCSRSEYDNYHASYPLERRTNYCISN